MTDRRSPYLILGIDHGTDAAQAAAAFARAARRIRTDTTSSYSIEDVTWALHRIEQAATDPLASLDTFRIPADPTVYFDAQIGEFLPEPSPLAPTTSRLGTGHQLVQDRALLAELRHDLAEASSKIVDRPVIEPTPVDVDPQTEPTRQAGPSTGQNTETAKPAVASSGNGNAAVWWAIAVIIVVIIVGVALTDQNGTGSGSSPNDQPSDDGGRATEAATAPSPPPSSEPVPDPRPTSWVERGDCLVHVGDDQWRPGPCGNHDAEIISTHRDRRDADACPDGTDASFDDAWGVYCSLIVSDETPDGGHWGIGPIRGDTCLDFSSQGHLRGKTTCTASSIPVLTTADSPEACDVPWAISDYFIYWEAVDGTNNVLCVDRFYWDAAGLPPPD